jgi:hypothetical protein
MPVAIHNGTPFVLTRLDRHHLGLNAHSPQHSEFGQLVLEMEDGTPAPYLAGFAHLVANSPRLLAAAEAIVSNYSWDLADSELLQDLRAAIAACRGEEIVITKPIPLPPYRG